MFDYQLRENVIVPTAAGGRGIEPRRVVFSLNMMGLGNRPALAMADATAKAIQATGIQPEEVDFVVPHQAGTSVVGLTAMRLEQLGIRGEVINGLTRNVGNISSSVSALRLEAELAAIAGHDRLPNSRGGQTGLRCDHARLHCLPKSMRTSAAAPISLMPNVNWQLSNS